MASGILVMDGRFSTDQVVEKRHVSLFTNRSTPTHLPKYRLFVHGTEDLFGFATYRTIIVEVCG